MRPLAGTHAHREAVCPVTGAGLGDVATNALKLTSESTEAVLQGRTYAGVAIAGTDSVNVVP